MENAPPSRVETLEAARAGQRKDQSADAEELDVE
jgi:hypothetical protein